MAVVYYNQNPTTSDTVLFNLITTDLSGIPVDPYKVNTIIIYFIERGFTVDNVYQYTVTVGSEIHTEYFKEAVPVVVFGNNDLPAWIGTDLSHAFVTKLDGETGVFQLEWNPQMSREGDYLLCYQWTPMPAGDVISNNIAFYLYSDTRQTTSIPTHYTDPTKYPTLLDRYQPPMFSATLGSSDLTPDILNRLNQAIANGFVVLEDQTNQIVDLIDANAVNDALLPYLGNLFGIRLFGSDTTLWRKQIKRAIPLAKMKGTMAALQEAFSNADMQFIKFTRLWQLVSSSTWRDGFVITAAQAAQSLPVTFTLSKVAILPIDLANFSLSIRNVGTTTYTTLTSDYVTFDNSSGSTIMTWVGNNLSMNPIDLQEGDVVVVIYKVNEPVNQSNEDYIRTLPVADQRDETLVTYPVKNWNVRLIAEDDPMFDVLIPDRHPFTYPVVFGKVRTEFPYSENVYNMETYNGSTRDSTNPCDIDKTFVDSCSACLSSKFNIDIEIEDLSAERIEEANDIITRFVPFHGVVQSVNFTGSETEFMPSPVEDYECLISVIQNDNVVATQMDFNRLIYDGSSDANTLKRNMLASTTATAASGTGTNLAISLFSPGIQFSSLSFTNSSNTYLEILSGSDQGEYQVQAYQRFTVDIVQGQPDTINWPLDTSSFPFRISNLLFSGLVDITEVDDYRLLDANATFVTYGTSDTWKVVVTSGPYVGTYNINSINPDNTISLSGFPTGSVSGLSYQLVSASNQVRFTSTTGAVNMRSVGIVDFGINAYDMGIRSGDYVKYLGTQYQVSGVDVTTTILNYTGGNVVGTASVNVYRRVIDNAVGYLTVRGMQINGTVPTIDYTAETNTFRENYLILIGTNYYQIDSVNGSVMVLNGPMLSWGLTGTSVDYSIVQFIKTSPITTEVPRPEITYAESIPYERLDRRGNDSIKIEIETQMPMFMKAAMLNGVNSGQPVESVSQQEQIWFNVEYKE